MTTTTPTNTSILASLRALTPRCQVDFDDTKQLAERQAVLLRQRFGGIITEEAIAGLPRVRIVREPLPTSGLSYWTGHEWLIVLAADDSPARQRYTLLHEFKHVIDHGAARRLYRTQWETERAADYFAACALMPKPALKRIFCNVTQDVEALARYFGVSRQAIRVRLEQTGLVERETFTRERCARPIPTPWHEEQRFVPVKI